MAARMRVNAAAFDRLRAKADALVLTDGDKSGPLLVELDQENIRQVRRAFASRGGTVESGPWPAWSPRYARWRAKHSVRLGLRMMRLTDTFFGKLTSPSHGDHIAVWRGGLRYAFGAADEVGAMHQAGGGHLPKRSAVDKTRDDITHFLAVFKGWYLKRLDQVLRHS